jgi:hypothetical protein
MAWPCCRPRMPPKPHPQSVGLLRSRSCVTSGSSRQAM